MMEMLRLQALLEQSLAEIESIEAMILVLQQRRLLLQAFAQATKDVIDSSELPA